ncbi:MAG: hypothetical protein ACR2RE_02220 [Geminicoccaceae bacterium]
MMKLVYIEWIDSFGCSTTWTEIKEIAPELLVCVSVGFLAYDGEDCKVIVPHISQENHRHSEQQGCGDMCIPTVAVKKMIELQRPQ